MDKLYCSKCGKCMTSENDTSFIGFVIEVSLGKEMIIKNDELLQLAQKQLGKYELNKKYQFCYECWLDSLFR